MTMVFVYFDLRNMLATNTYSASTRHYFHGTLYDTMTSTYVLL